MDTKTAKATFETATLVGALKAAKTCMSKDPTRVNLNRLCIEKAEGETVKVIATDGHTLCLVTAPILENELQNAGTRYELTSADIDMILARAKSKPATLDIELREETSEFPEYEKVIPKYTSNESLKGPIGFNAKYLARLEDVSNAIGNKCTGATTLKFGLNDHDAMVAEITGANSSAIIVIMPMRI